MTDSLYNRLEAVRCRASALQRTYPNEELRPVYEMLEEITEVLTRDYRDKERGREFVLQGFKDRHPNKDY